jgi:large subunit ribosomal protein L35
MGYKMKPNKSMLSRFKVTKKGKLKRHHANTSHLLSNRSAKTKRRLGRPAILHEGLAKNMRRMMGVGHLNPIRADHDARVKAQAEAKAGAAVAETK